MLKKCSRFAKFSINFKLDDICVLGVLYSRQPEVGFIDALMFKGGGKFCNILPVISYVLRSIGNKSRDRRGARKRFLSNKNRSVK